MINNINNSFSNPTVVATGLHQSTNIAVHPTNGNVYWKNSNNKLKVLYYTGSTYGIGTLGHTPNDVKGGITVSPSNNHHGTRVYYISTNNDRLCYYEYCSGWHRHETPITNVKELVISNSPQGKIFYRGNDNNIWTVWKYWDNNTPCNSSNPVSGWSYAPLHYPYSSNADQCAGDLAITPNGSTVFYRTHSDNLAYWKVQGTTQRVITEVDDVVGDIEANQMPDGRIEAFYIAKAENVGLYGYKIKTYYERNAPLIDNKVQWQNSTLDVFSPGVGGSYNADYIDGYHTGHTISISNTHPAKIFGSFGVSTRSTNTVDRSIGQYEAKTNLPPLSFTPYGDCVPYTLSNAYIQGYHVGLEKMLSSNQEQPDNLKDNLKTKDKSSVQNNVVYPNPTNGNVTIELSSDWCDANIKIYDVQGKEIQHQQNVCKQVTFDMSDYPEGIYLVRILKGENIQNIKLLKQ
ncbi:MAG: T9SS type A sorting domain-containing protein [Saprospiraceae bacterium]